MLREAEMGHLLVVNSRCWRLVVTEEMPKPVWWFEKLMWGSLLLIGLIGPLDWNRLLSKAVHQGANAHIPDSLLTAEFKAASVVMFCSAVAIVLLLLTLVWLIARRRIGWVRWLVGVMFVLGLPSVFADLPAAFSVSPIVAVLKTAQMVLQMAALVLIFLPSARPWYTKPAAGMASA